MSKEKKAEEGQKEVQGQKETKVDSVPAVKKEEKKSEIKEEKIELEREYVIPLRRGILKVSRHRRAKKAVRLVREFLAKHMRVEDRDLRKVKINQYLNEELWFRGIRKPASKIKVKAIKKGGIVYAELFELPTNLKFAKERNERKALNVKPLKHEQKKEEKQETPEEKKDEKEKEVSSVEAGKKRQKEEAKTTKHSTHSEHEHKTHPKRQSLKK